MDVLEADLAASESGDAKAAVAKYKSKLRECSDARAALLEEKEGTRTRRTRRESMSRARSMSSRSSAWRASRTAHARRRSDAEVASLISDLEKCDRDSSRARRARTPCPNCDSSPGASPPRTPSPSSCPTDCDETLYGREEQEVQGCQTRTIGGTVPAVDEPVPHAHAQTEDRFIDETLEEAGNYCRNPDGGDTIWCYTTDPEKRWEYCQPAPVDYWCADENGECECVGGVVVYGREDPRSRRSSRAASMSSPRVPTRSGATTMRWATIPPRATSSDAGVLPKGRSRASRHRRRL